jgi:hypothetical protein
MAYSSRSRTLAEGAATEIQTNVQRGRRFRNEPRPLAAYAPRRRSSAPIKLVTVTGGSSAAALVANLRRDQRDDCGR